MKFKGPLDERQQIKLSQTQMGDKAAPKWTVDAKAPSVMKRAEGQDA
ncbi:hypothetical protein [Cupriavidus gilardii]|nr:hypothetical protein [Cupriavidus gilardii]UXC38263.1 hypothetical protein N4G38_24695 [Cupriavidus gilardii]